MALLSPARFIEIDNLGNELLRKKAAMKSRQFSSLVQKEVIPAYMKKRGVSYYTAKIDVARAIRVATFGKGWNYLGLTVVADVLSNYRFKPLYDYAKELMSASNNTTELMSAVKEIKMILSLVRKGKDLGSLIKTSRSKFRLSTPFDGKRALDNILAAYPDLTTYLKEKPRTDFMGGIWKAYEKDTSNSLGWEARVHALSGWIDHLEAKNTKNADKLASILTAEMNGFFTDLF